MFLAASSRSAAVSWARASARGQGVRPARSQDLRDQPERVRSAATAGVRHWRRSTIPEIRRPGGATFAPAGRAAAVSFLLIPFFMKTSFAFVRLVAVVVIAWLAGGVLRAQEGAVSAKPAAAPL